RSLPTIPIERTAAAAKIPMIVTTTSSSSSENPGAARDLVEIPVPDVGVDAFAAFLAVGTKRVDIEFPALAWIGVLIGLVPGVGRHASQVPTWLPVRSRRVAWAGHQCFQSFVRAGILEIIQPIKIQSRFDAADILLRAAHRCTIDVAY